MRLNQVTLPSTDVERSAEFFKRLGLKQIVEAEGRYARFECPDGESTLSVHLADVPIGQKGTVIYFECDDLDETVAALEASGIVFTSGPADMRWLWREARLTDPDGNQICLFYAGDNRRYPPWRLSDD